MRTKEQIGNIQSLIDEVERATREFETAVEGPEFQDYASDEHAYRALEAPARALSIATADILAALNPAASREQPSEPPPNAWIDWRQHADNLVTCHERGQISSDEVVASLRLCLKRAESAAAPSDEQEQP